MHISEMEQKIEKKSSVFEIKAFEIVAENSAYSGRNTFHRQSMCLETVLRFLIRVKKSFFNSIYHKFSGKKDNSGAFLLSTVFGTR